MIGKVIKWVVKKVAEAWTDATKEDPPVRRRHYSNHLLTNLLVKDSDSPPAGPEMKAIVTIHYGEGNDEIVELNWNRGLHYHLKRKEDTATGIIEEVVELELLSIMPNSEVHKMVTAEAVTFKLYVESEVKHETWTMSTGPLKLKHYGGTVGFIGPVEEALNFTGSAKFLQPWHKMTNDKVHID